MSASKKAIEQSKATLKTIPRIKVVGVSVDDYALVLQNAMMLMSTGRFGEVTDSIRQEIADLDELLYNFDSGFDQDNYLVTTYTEWLIWAGKNIEHPLHHEARKILSEFFSHVEEWIDENADFYDTLAVFLKGYRG